MYAMVQHELIHLRSPIRPTRICRVGDHPICAGGRGGVLREVDPEAGLY
jgi:hypothetical protein